MSPTGLIGKSLVVTLVIAGTLTLLPDTPAAAQSLYRSPDAYEDYIILHESSGRVAVSNYLGCIGLMQSCGYKGSAPGLAIACPDWRVNIDCQLTFFTGYMLRRYGSWYNAYVHETSRGWW